MNKRIGPKARVDKCLTLRVKVVLSVLGMIAKQS